MRALTRIRAPRQPGPAKTDSQEPGSPAPLGPARGDRALRPGGDPHSLRVLSRGPGVWVARGPGRLRRHLADLQAAVCGPLRDGHCSSSPTHDAGMQAATWGCGGRWRRAQAEAVGLAVARAVGAAGVRPVMGWRFRLQLGYPDIAASGASRPRSTASHRRPQACGAARRERHGSGRGRQEGGCGSAQPWHDVR